MKNIRLLINLYPMAEGERLDEIVLCLQKNIANPWISEIVVLDEGFQQPELLNCPKVIRRPITGRPNFADYFDHLSTNGFNLLANNDIRFDDTLKHIRLLAPGPYDLLSLTRREADGKLYNPHEADTQDAWLFLGKAEPLKACAFPMGIPGCENRMVFEFFARRYRVLNPARLIRIHHEHRSQSRGYQEVQRIPGPYLLSRPIGLCGFHIYRLILKLIQRTRILRVKYLGDITAL